MTFLLQMHGMPGSGKSTLATAIGRKTGALVLDKDIVKSRILDGEEEAGLAGLAESVAAPLHHALMFDLANSLLAQGFSVIVDGAAFYPIVRRKGAEIAARHGAEYYIVECSLPELAARQARIGSKVLMTSHPGVATPDGYERPGTIPLNEPHLSLDTGRPFEEYLAEALKYIGHGQG